MFRYWLFCLLLVMSGTFVQAQTAVYICEKTGRFGVASDDGNAPRMTMEETRKAALKRCTDLGGEDCKLFFSSDTKGWYGLFTGGDKGKYVFAIGQSTQSEKGAMKKAIDDYLQKGGIMAPGAVSSTWYLPKDVIKTKKNR